MVEVPVSSPDYARIILAGKAVFENNMEVEEASNPIFEVIAERDGLAADAVELNRVIDALSAMESLPLEFDDVLWHSTVDHMTVHFDETITFHIYGGIEITREL